MAKSVIRPPKKTSDSTSSRGAHPIGASPTSHPLPTERAAKPSPDVGGSTGSRKVTLSTKVTSSTTGKAVRSRSLQREYLNRLTQEFDPTATLEEMMGLPIEDEEGSRDSSDSPLLLGDLATTHQIAQERTWAIYDAILSGYPRSFIEYQYAVQFDVTTRVVRKYYTVAKRLIAAIAKETQVEMLTHHMAFRRQLRVKALESDDLELAFAAAKDEAKLYGLYPEQSLAVNVSATASLHLPAEVLHLLDVVYGPKDGQTPITREGMDSLDEYDGTGFDENEVEEYSDEELADIVQSSSELDLPSSEMRDQEEVL